ncbi:MAG: 4Fe-4S binding protein [Eubacteriales bacterium]|nr:4Fe-4S binding protein [Eubacteriales bacterium]
MKVQSVTAVYFSATDTTRTVVCRIAQRAADRLHVPCRTVDFTLPDARRHTTELSRTELVIFGVPVYAGRIPNLLLPFVRTGFLGCDTPAVPVVLYGNRNYDDALIELRDVLESSGFHTIAAGAFIGEHSFSYTLAAGRPDAADLALADTLAERVTARITGTEALPERPVPVRGQTPLRPYYTPRDRAGNPVNILKVKPKTNEGCDQCGLCITVCPMGAIDAGNPRAVTGICIKCGACVKKCPQHAKYYDDEKYLYHQHELEEGFARRAEPELF